MRIVHVSDTHEHPLAGLKMEGNLLLHTGDFSYRGTIDALTKALKDLATFKYDFDEIGYIAGNHDFLFESNPKTMEMLSQSLDIKLMNDSGFEFDGVKIWGSPITPWFHDWAFNRHRGPEIQKHWKLIPSDTNILMTHGPVAGILDRTSRGDSAGCIDLLNTIKSTPSIKLHLCGHIHEAHGVEVVDGVTYSNASLMNLQYRFTQKPNVFELDIKSGKVTHIP